MGEFEHHHGECGPYDGPVPPTPFSDFYDPLRIMLGDMDPQGIFQYQNAALDGALRTVFFMGRQPGCYQVVGSRTTGNTIAPGIPNGDDCALVTLEAALLLIGGDVGGEQYRTRAIQHRTSGDRVKNLLIKIRLELYAIKGGGQQCFATYQSFMTWMNSFQDVRELVGINIEGPVLSMNVSQTGLPVVL